MPVRANETASLGSPTPAPDCLIRMVLRLVGVGPSSSSIIGKSRRAVLFNTLVSPESPSGFAGAAFCSTLMVAASVGLLSLIVFGPSPVFVVSSANAASREIREVFRFSSVAEATTGAGGFIATGAILPAPGDVGGLILIVFGTSVGLPSEIPGLDGAANSRGILDVSFFDVIMVFASADGTACTGGFGVNGGCGVNVFTIGDIDGFVMGFPGRGSGAAAEAGLTSGIVIRMVSLFAPACSDFGCAMGCVAGVILGATRAVGTGGAAVGRRTGDPEAEGGASVGICGFKMG